MGLNRWEPDHENFRMFTDDRYGRWVKHEDVIRLENLLVKIRDSGHFFISAIELEHDVDGEELLKEIEALIGD